MVVKMYGTASNFISRTGVPVAPPSPYDRMPGVAPHHQGLPLLPMRANILPWAPSVAPQVHATAAQGLLAAAVSLPSLRQELAMFARTGGSPHQRIGPLHAQEEPILTPLQEETIFQAAFAQELERIASAAPPSYGTLVPGRASFQQQIPLQSSGAIKTFIAQSPQLASRVPPSNVSDVFLRRPSQLQIGLPIHDRLPIHCRPLPLLRKEVTTTRPIRNVERFPVKLHRMLTELAESSEAQDILSFTPSGRAFKIHQPRAFVSEVAPKFYRLKDFRSFTRQVRDYSFKRVKSGPDTGAYYHVNFQRDKPELCKKMFTRTRDEVPTRPVPIFYSPPALDYGMNTKAQRYHG